MKRLTALLLCAVLMLSLCSCGTQKHETGEISFTDDTGRQINISKPERVAALLGSFADMWLLAGGELCAVTDGATQDFSLALSEDTVMLGREHHPDSEALILAEPELVLASSKLSGHIELCSLLENSGIAVAYFDVSGFEDYLRVLKIMTDITGRPELYELYGENQREKIDEITARCNSKASPSVLVMRASASSIRAKNSEGTMLGGMLRDMGCRNIADSDSMLLENLSVESIALENPDMIFFVQTGDSLESVRSNVEKMFRENPLWSELDAVKQGRVYYMEKELFNLKPNARFAQAYEKLEKLIYEK